MLERLARFLLRRRWAVLAATLVVVVAAGAFGGSAITRLKSGGFDDPGAESTRAAKVLADAVRHRRPQPGPAGHRQGRHGRRPGRGRGRGGAHRAAGRRARRGPGRLLLVPRHAPAAEEHRRHARRWCSAASPATRRTSTTGRPRSPTPTPATTPPSGSRSAARPRCSARSASRSRPTWPGRDDRPPDHPAPAGAGVRQRRGRGRCRWPSAASPSSARSLVLRVLAEVTDVSIFALNLTTALGLGLAIDYSLFVVSRYREELAPAATPADAVVRTVRTAGRTVLFSAATVAVSLLALLVFPLSFLRSFAYAGIAVAVLAAVGAVVVLPGAAGRARPPGRPAPAARSRRATRPRPSRGRASGTASPPSVMRRPVPIATAVVAFLRPARQPVPAASRFGLPDDRVLPAGADGRQVAEDRSGRTSPPRRPSALSVVARGHRRPGRRTLADIDGYAAALSRLDGVARVDAAHRQLPSAAAPGSPRPGRGARGRRFAAADGTGCRWCRRSSRSRPRARTLVDDVRRPRRPVRRCRSAGRRPSWSTPRRRCSARLPLAGGDHRPGHLRAAVPDVRERAWCPLKALVLNILSLTATFGAMVWIFQDGHLSGVLGLHATGTIDTTMPILHVLHRLRAVDGLRGVPPVPDQGGARPHRRQRRRRWRRAWSAPAASSPPRPPCSRVVFLAFATSRGQLHQAVRHRHSPWPSWSTPS